VLEESFPIIKHYLPQPATGVQPRSELMDNTCHSEQKKSNNKTYKITVVKATIIYNTKSQSSISVINLIPLNIKKGDDKNTYLQG